MAARLIKFVGSHSRLITGHLYSARDYANAANISPHAMATRLHRTFEVNNSHLLPINKDTRFGGGDTKRTPRDPADKSRFETLGEKLSGEWINKRIVG